jgi:hypothetical protein
VSRRAAGVRRGAGSEIVTGTDGSIPVALPRDHPKWARDRFTISAATKAFIDRLKPVAIRVFGFWDHRAHHLAFEHGTIEIDASGSYRCETSTPALEKHFA